MNADLGGASGPDPSAKRAAVRAAVRDGTLNLGSGAVGPKAPVGLDEFLERVADRVSKGGTVEKAVALEFGASVPAAIWITEAHLDMFREALVRLAKAGAAA